MVAGTGQQPYNVPMSIVDSAIGARPRLPILIAHCISTLFTGNSAVTPLILRDELAAILRNVH